MPEKVEGTLVLDGMIEGRVSAQTGFADRLQRWVADAADAGLRLHLQTDGNNFSVLADNQPASVAGMKGDASGAISAKLRELLRIFPPPERTKLFSTLRSVEYGKGEEVQSLYAITPDGKVDVQQRTVEASTVAPPQPLSGRDRVKLALTGLAAAAILFGVSTFFIDYRGLWREVGRQVTPLDANKIAVETPELSRYFTVESKQLGKGRDMLVVVLRRTADFPRSSIEADKAATRPAELTGRLALEAVTQGYVRCEFFDEKNEFLRSSFLRIRGLAEKETLEVALPLYAERQPAAQRIVLSY